MIFGYCDKRSMYTFQRLYVMSTFSTLLRFLYCDMSTLSTLLRYVYIFPRCCATCISTILCYCAMSTFSTLLCFVSFSMLLRNVYSCHTTALYLPFSRCCAMSSLSTWLRYVYFFHAAAPCLLFPPSCLMSTLCCA